jgi:hypothetical protein
LVGLLGGLSEKNVANLADKKKTLEITGLFCKTLVRQLADKEWRAKSEVRGQMSSRKTQEEKREH